LRCILLRIRIRVIAVIALIPVAITGSHVKPLEFSCSMSSLAVSGDDIALVDFVTFIVVILAGPRHPETQFVIRTIVVYGILASVFPISGISSATLQVKQSRRITFSTHAAAVLMTLAGIGFSACWI
jgi:hypothetical protein